MKMTHGRYMLHGVSILLPITEARIIGEYFLKFHNQNADDRKSIGYRTADTVVDSTEGRSRGGLE